MAKTSLTDAVKALTSNTQYNDGVFGGAFPSGTPMQSAEPERVEPRLFRPNVAQNLVLEPRKENSLTGFDLIDWIAENTDLIQLAEDIKINQICGIGWDIVNAEEDDKTDYSKEIEEVKKFFQEPETNFTWYEWIRLASQAYLRFDNLTIYKQRNKKGDLIGLKLVDGRNIKPIVTSDGDIPLPPNPAYQQIIYGTVRGSWTVDEIIYKPKNRRLNSMYGRGAVERIMAGANKYLKKLGFDIAYYSNTSYPNGGIYALEPNDQASWTPEQIEQYQEKWNASLIDYSSRQSIKFAPKGTYINTKTFNWDTKQEEWFAKLVCASYGIPQQTFIHQMNRATAETADKQQTDTGLTPDLKYFEAILTWVIATEFDKPYLRFNFLDEKNDDEQLTVDKNIKYVNAGIYSRNEIRLAEGREAIDGGNAYIVLAGQTPINVDTFDGAEVENEPEPTPQPEDEELKRYQKFLTNRVKTGKALRKFEAVNISSDKLAIIENGLSLIKSVDDVKELFKKVSKKKINDTIITLEDNLHEHLDDVQRSFVAWAVSNYANNPQGLLDNLHSFIFFDNTQPVYQKIVDGLQTMAVDGQKTAIDTIKAEAIKQDVNLDTFGITVETGYMRAIKVADKQAADLVTNIDKSTRDFLRTTIESNIKNEGTWQELRDKIANNDYYAFSEQRAATIARTEQVKALNQGAIETYKESGLVEKVEVSDGDSDEECQAVDGTIQSLDWAEDNLLEHPNCVRAFTPVVDFRINNESD